MAALCFRSGICCEPTIASNSGGRLRGRIAQAGLILAAFVACNIESSGQDWPQWRGPLRDGISSERALLPEWPVGGPPLLWSRNDIGSGFSAPAVVGDRLYIQANRGVEDEFVQALAADDGRTVWAVRIGRVGNPDQAPSHPAARSTPTVAGDWLYALGSDGDLVCLHRDNGRVRWQVNLRAAFKGQPGSWAYSESPRVDDQTVIVTPGGPEATLAALDAITGRVKWKAAVPGGDAAAYSSPSLAVVDGQKVYVQFVEKGLVGVDAGSGAFLWRYDKANQTRAKIPTPVTNGPFVYTASAPIGGALLRLEKTASGIVAREVYLLRGLPYSIGGSVLVNDVLYGTTADGLVAVDFQTGASKWRDESIGPSSLLYADGRLYLHGEGGDVALVEASPERYLERGRFTPPNRPKAPGDLAWTYPVLANGRLFIREHGTLWAYDVRRDGGRRSKSLRE